MKKHIHFLAHQITRFGAMSVSQMQLVCQGKCARATIYRMLEALIKSRDVIKTWHLECDEFMYQASPRLYEKIYGLNRKRQSGFCENTIAHAKAVADVFTTLSCYSFVNGIATEHEIDPLDLPKFCYSKIPDGLIQINDGTRSFVLAVEVELSQKNSKLIDEVVEKYKITLSKGLLCAGLILVVRNEAILNAYQKKINEVLSEYESRVLTLTFENLPKLNQKYFGDFKNCPQGALEKIGTTSQAGIEFSLMKSIKGLETTPSKSPHLERPSMKKQKDIYEDLSNNTTGANCN